MNDNPTYGSLPFSETRMHLPLAKGQGTHALLSPSLFRRAQVVIQLWIGRVTLIPFCGFLVFLMHRVRGYRIENLSEVREAFRKACDDDTPLMICANHLTFIDSALMVWAMAPNRWYLFNYRRFSWNLPAGDFFKKKFIFRIIAYLTKCIFIHRDGSKVHKDRVLGLCRYLLNRGEIVSIFPEGRRSRVGHFDDAHITFGVGKIIAGMERCRVLCVYLRSDKQKMFSNYPAKNSQFKILWEEIVPRTDERGRDAYFDIAGQIAKTIKKLEGQYFNAAG